VTVNAQRTDPDGYRVIVATIKDLISFAFSVPFGVDGLISGGPNWVNSATFDIVAKAEEPIPAAQQKIPNRVNLMVQTLLADRFKLKIHPETKEIPVYALVVGKNGSKLTPWAAPSTPAADNTPTYAFGANLPTPQKGRGMRLVRGDMQAQGVTTNWLAGYLQFQPEIAGRTVIDKTGLADKYDLTLKWLPEGPEASDLPKHQADLPGLFTAIQEQLGLKLDSTKGTTDIIVIDHVEMPSEN